MRRSGSNQAARRGFTLIEVALAVVIGSMLLASVSYATMAYRKAAGNVYDETFLQTITRDVQLNLERAMGQVDRNGVPSQVLMSGSDMAMGNARLRFVSAVAGAPDPGGRFEYSQDNGATWRSMADIGARGMFDETEFAYGKFVPNEDTGIPTPDRTTYVIDERVRENLMRVTSVLQKHDMVPLYLQVARSPRSLTWSWVENSVHGDPTKDSDNDGVNDADDDFPLDKERGFRDRYPEGKGSTASIAFEDNFPNLGDADYNDFVAAFYLSETYGPGIKEAPVLTKRPGLKEIYMRFFAQARGAGYNHALRLKLSRWLPGGGKVKVQRYNPQGELVSEEVFEAGSRNYMDIFPDTRTQMPPSNDGWSTNARPGTDLKQSWTTVVYVTVADPAQNRYGNILEAPYDLYLYVKDTKKEIHLPMVPSVANGPKDSYRNDDNTLTKMIDTNGDAWALLVPTNWRWPLEEQKIDVAFPQYRPWVQAGRPDSMDWYSFPLETRYKVPSNNPSGKAAPSPHPNWRSIDDMDVAAKARYVYVFDPKLFTNSEGAFLAPVTLPSAQATTAPVVSPSPGPSIAPSPSPSPSPSPGGGNLHPIALHANVLVGKASGDPLKDIYCGNGSGNFGWMSWDGDGSAPRLAVSLAYPGDSRTYINPNDANDHEVNVGDWIRGNTGISNSSSVRTRLTELKAYDITVPVWDTATGSGSNARYHCVAFANVRITDYQLSSSNRISAKFLGYADNRGSLVGAPASAAPSPTPGPSLAPSPSPTPTPTPTPSPTPTPPASDRLMPIGLMDYEISGRSSGADLGWMTAGQDGVGWLTWAGDTSESVWRTSMALPGNSGTYRNPVNSSDTHIDVGDRIVFFSDVSNGSSNRNAVDAMDNQTVVIPVFSSASGNQATVSGFCKVRVTDRSLSGSSDQLRLTFMGRCNSAGGAL